MKIQIIKYLYKNESETKQKRRQEICLNILKIKNNETILALNYNEIAKELNIERKTLYNYFSTREELMITLALVIVEDNYSNQQKFINTILKLNPNAGMEVLSNLTPILKFIKNKKTINRALYLSNFEHNLYFLADNEPLINKYKDGLNFLRHEYSFIETIIQNAIDKKQVELPKNMDVHQFAVYIEQTVVSVYYRTILMENLDDNVDFDIFINYIKILLESFKPKNR